MKTPVKLIVIAFVTAVAVISCKKESVTDDFLPLKVGTKYLYTLHDFYSEISPSESFTKEGECEWTFTSLNTDIDTVKQYIVQQIFNGIHVYIRFDIMTDTIITCDTTIIENEVTELIFMEYNDGRIKINVPSFHYYQTTEYFHRYIETTENEICIPDYPDLCLQRNVGIKYLDIKCHCNHQTSTKYTWKKGPYR